MATAAGNFRKVHLNNDEENERLRREGRYTDNYVTTSKYTIVSFVPKMLFEFFRVIANCYFLVISILQVATTWSPTNKYTTAGPLVIVLLVSMIKQGVEDKKRHDADNVQNSRHCKVLGRHGEIVTKEWQEVLVGDVLRLGDRDEAPADVFILSTSEEEGRCFVETCNLDGETNLKRRSAIEPVAQHIGYRNLNDPALPEAEHSKKMMQFSATMEYEQPNNRLYNFTGRIEFGPNKEAAPIGPSNIILRGCSVRGCAYIYGVVIFTGSETKLMQNARATPSKQSNVYKVVNRCILLIFITQFVLCIISTICNTIWMDKYEEHLWYFSSAITRTSSASNLVSFFTFLILYNNLVPISLYVSLDMVKVVQAKNISNDPEMCHEGTYANARTSDLNEELGQIHHIFSDKTGTLTCNIMEFRKCFIAGVSYGFGTTEIGRAVAEMAKKNATTKGESSSSNDKGDDDKHHDPRDAQVDFNPLIHFDDPRLINALADNGPEAAAIDEFLTVLSVCHTVIPENNAKTGEVDYRASSPDEEALVKAAKCLGYNFFAPAPLLEVKVTTKQGVSAVRKYTILNVNEFNSTRKRMSITLRTEDGRYFLYCKGADNVMMPRSKIDEHTAKMDEELKRFASEGLRTLVICSKELTEEEYLAWDVMYQEAVTSLTNRDELLEEVAELIETEMKIVGASAIEDKLQKGVPTAIANLAQAGIKIWMLTGDKEETAINIGHACQLINDGMRLLIVNCEDLDDLGRQVDKIYKLDDVQSHINSNKVSSHLALVCDGKAMVHVFPPKNATSERALHAAKVLSQMILEISSVCQAVIACRVSPAQKADIVNLIRYNSPQKPIALAIGEEANDENMIQSAHVGVGVSGQEGVQAVNASDYAIAQFRFLERLLLVHGRYNYQRISKIILYSFYKNVALVIALFLFNFYNGQSGTSVFESFIMAGWNFFLALPIIAIGIFDEDVAPEQVLRNPVLYLPGQKNEGINMKRFSTWLFNAIVQAFICFMLAMYGTINVGGFSAGLYLQGSVIYSVLLMSANLKVILETLSWTKFNRLVLAFSLWLFFFFLLVFPFMGSLGRDLYGVSLQLLSSAVFWLYLLLVPLTANLIDICIKYIQNIYFPTLANVLRERCVLSANSAQVACDPLDEQKSGLLSVPFYELYKGFVFSSAETDGGDKDERDSRELTSLKVLEFHREAVASFTKERSASFSPTGAIVPGPSTSSAHLSGHFSSSHLSAHHSQRGT
ncbi:Phospholipid-transporting ATPase [Phytophthora fragariae]|uniref:Phospholipid-transporting ATPase n=1 Tax=Phytophthora fragariae TaxID=53985 RepID=A0A6A4AL16_9STRA|nr:Phospholipid-transporting ATPase [Phytophthora fragariae]KAE9258511.1 Phospholipid-transporting ATPase [Phytophthora fragariae]